MGFGEVIETDLGGVDSSPRTAAGDDGDRAISAGGEEVTLLGDGVDGIRHRVGITGKEFFRILFRVEALLDDTLGLGIDRANPLCQNHSL